MSFQPSLLRIRQVLTQLPIRHAVTPAPTICRLVTFRRPSNHRLLHQAPSTLLSPNCILAPLILKRKLGKHLGSKRNLHEILTGIQPPLTSNLPKETAVQQVKQS